MERQRQKVLQDGEYIMYETPPQRQVSFHLPPETNGYGKLLINNYLPTDQKISIHQFIAIEIHEAIFYVSNTMSYFE